MLAALLRGTDWSKIADYLSPVLFHIVPPLSMAKEIRTLVSAYRNRERFQALKDAMAPKLAALDWGIRLADETPSPQDRAAAPSPLSAGDRVLRLYFWQLLAEPEAILDLRHKCWQKTEEGALLWTPSALYIHWDPVFIDAVRKMYRGFYHQDDALFDSGLEAIGLSPGKPVLIQHFGSDPENVTFDLAKFRSSFHEMFVACRDANTRLHPNVLGLGAVLACLYDHLQGEGGTFNVKAAFLDAERLCPKTTMTSRKEASPPPRRKKAANSG